MKTDKIIKMPQKTIVEFAYSPLTKVKIKVYGCVFEGRILSCQYSGKNMNLYECEFIDSGVFTVREFYEDELEVMK